MADALFWPRAIWDHLVLQTGPTTQGWVAPGNAPSTLSVVSHGMPSALACCLLGSVPTLSKFVQPSGHTWYPSGV